MRIGIDFDNTIAGYDRLFADLAAERGLAAFAFGPGKRAIRDASRTQEHGETAWQELQAAAYGARMWEAELIDGVAPFFERARARGVPVYVVSHKSRFANRDPDGVDLRRAALCWMDALGFFSDARFGLSREKVFFEDTRAAKIERIGALGCTHFIDDLEDVFFAGEFPAAVAAIHYAPAGPAANGGITRELESFADWRDIMEYLLGKPA